MPKKPIYGKKSARSAAEIRSAAERARQTAAKTIRGAKGRAQIAKAPRESAAKSILRCLAPIIKKRKTADLSSALPQREL